MNGPDILDQNRNLLANLIMERGNDIPRFAPLNINPWLASSLLQKAIRRGREDLALGAAATLLQTSPDRLWRRLCVVSFEDVGVADFDTVSLVMAGLTGKHWRSKNGGEWAVASYLIGRMCRTIKCRATDDLAYVCELHPDYEQARLELINKPIPELLEIIAGKCALPERALALWFAIGTHRCRSKVLQERTGDPHGVLDALCERGYPETIIEVCRTGLTKSGEIMAPFLILLWRELQKTTSHSEPDSLPEEEMIGEVPVWAYDMHTREGKQAIAQFLKMDCETVRWLSGLVPPAKRNHLLGNMIFSVEGGLVDRRLRWKAGDRLRNMVHIEVGGIAPKDMKEGLELLRIDLPKLNEARRQVVAENVG